MTRRLNAIEVGLCGLDATIIVSMMVICLCVGVLIGLACGLRIKRNRAALPISLPAQVDLDPASKRALYENLWELYGK